MKIKVKTMNVPSNECITTGGLHIVGLNNVKEQPIHFLIYKMVNNVNGKYYIGKHKTINVLDNYTGSGIILSQAVKKYGVSNFTKIILLDLPTEEEMNLAEKELVSEEVISDNTSYNLAIGGDGGNRGVEAYKKFKVAWSQKTDEEIADIVAKRRLSLDARTPEQKAHTSMLKSKAAKLTSNSLAYREKMNQFWKNLTPEQRESIHNNHVLAWQNMDPDKKQQISKQRSDRMNSRTKEQIDEQTRKTKTTIKNRTAERQLEVSKHHSEATAKMWSSNSYRENWHNAIDSRTDAQKKVTLELRRTTIANRTDEQNAIISANISNAGKEAYRRDPDRAKRHSIRMKGENNPAFWRKWMCNPITGEIVYAKREEFDMFLNEGYVFGKKGLK